MPFPFFAALAVLSARAHQPDAELVLLSGTEPVGRYWELVAPLVTLAPKPPGDVESLLLHVVNEVGGLTIETDVLILNNMDHLAAHPFVIGIEPHAPGQSIRFGTSIMMGQRGNRFVRRWLAALRGGSSCENRSLLPLQLYAAAPEEATILPHDSWHAPHHLRLCNFLFDPKDGESNHKLVSDRFALHLRRTMNFDRLAEFTPVQMQNDDYLLARLGRSICAELPVAAAERVADHLRLPLGSSHG